MEELKLIIELASKVTNDAFWLLILYFGKSILMNIFGWTGVITIIIILTKFLFKVFGNHSALCQVHKAIDGQGYFDSFDQNHIKILIKDIQNYKKRKDDE